MRLSHGGSLAQAQHFAEELTGQYRTPRPPLPAIAITDPGHLSCVANDYGYDQVFARFVQAHARAGDVLLCLSTSGNSPNILRAAEQADRQQVTIIGLTGRDGGRLARLCDLEIRVAVDHFSDRIQEVHQVCLHAIINGIEHVMFPEAAR
jgi:Phosphoheptose isomerase